MNELLERPGPPASPRRDRQSVASIEPPFDLPDATPWNDEPDDASELEELGGPSIDDASWDAFVADEDERDPLPEPGDFWWDD